MSELSDKSMDDEAVRYLLRGQGAYKADGLAAELGFDRVKVKPFMAVAVDVWFYRPNDPCN